jgi:signal transduction histidine kinase
MTEPTRDGAAADPAQRPDRWHRRVHRRVHRRLRHSLHGRLVALFVLLSLGTALVFLGGTQRVVYGGFNVFVKPLLSDYVDRLAAEIGTPPEVARAEQLVARLPITVRIEGPAVTWDSRAGDAPARTPPWSGRWGGDGWHDDEPGSAWNALLERQTADGHRIRFGIDETPWREQRRARLWMPLLVLLGMTLLAFMAVRRMLRPLDDIRAGALRYGAGDFTQPIAVRRRDELGDLAGQVDAMAGSLHGMLQGQRELLLAISHELRSPLTRARLNTELLAEGRERDALLRDLELMRTLVADLLEGERLAAGGAALQREPTDLNALVREVVQAGFADCAPRLELDSAVPTLSLDAARVQMLVRNLVDNACRHGGGAEPVVVGTRVEPDAVVLTVRDHGPGVSEDQLARLAEPFYRPDAARTRAGGGVGLGLYLCRRVAQSHGATLTLRNAHPGLEVQVSWRA